MIRNNILSSLPIHLIIAALLLVSNPIIAQWSVVPTQNNAISLANKGQEFSTVTSDGAGGAIICWRDFRSETSLDIYAQRINSAGANMWTNNGISICSFQGDQYDPNIISDGAGGAFIAWTDSRGGNNHSGLYVQRIDAGGNLLWTSGGVEITADSVVSEAPKMVADANGGVIIAWEDIRKQSGVTGDIYAQRINAFGVIQWASRGVAICRLDGDQQGPSIVSDNAGGAIIVWEDARQSFDLNIYAQRINAAGVSQWTSNGIPVSSNADNDKEPKAISDGNGGIVVSWLHSSSSFVIAQKLNSNGVLQWDNAGVSITNSYYNYKVQMCTDGAGGAIIAWESLVTQVSAQRVTTSGSLHWGNSVFVSDSLFTQEKPQLISDNNGGAIVVWQDQRKGFFNTQIMAQHFNAVGQKMWAVDGIEVSSATYDVNDYDYKQEPQITSNGSGEAIVVWGDYRNESYKDVYAQLLGTNGISPAIVTSVNEVNALPFSQLSTYPNPVNDQSSIEFVLSSSSPVQIQVLNMLGETEIVILNNHYEAGNYSINWDASKLSNGPYLLQVKNKETVCTKQILVQH
ncbi:MAG: T9SS type A sorting domain-containing protein [Bacteroidetes bacterium]|nr:T9SS type A sorting domain-containing protein [Bacteroidota bacterium]